jgi:hypothetical protein
MRKIVEYSETKGYYGRLFSNRNSFTIYTINKLPEYMLDLFNNKEYCWISWIDGGIEYRWVDVINNINKGYWVYR